MKLHNHKYLGDGVYASFDGFQIWLHVGDHRNAPVVALEASVLAALNEYATGLKNLPLVEEQENAP